MSFTGDVITLVGLYQIDLPGHTVRGCDGGFCYYSGNKFTSDDSVIGSIAGIEAITDALGDSAPDFKMSFLPPSDEAAAVAGPGWQNARVRLWLGELHSDGKTVINAEQLRDGLIDYVVVSYPVNSALIELRCIDRAEKLFLTREGNVLSTRFHQTVWPGELGFDFANGLQTSVAWGAEAPTRSSTAATGTGL